MWRMTNAGNGGGSAPDESRPAEPARIETPKPREIGGPKGPEPTRFGDWEQKGRATDF